MALLARRDRASTPRHPEKRRPAAPAAELICLACGTFLAASLANAGALRCHDCRSADAQLDGTLLALQRSLSYRVCG
jgi:hypothetical protein